MAGQVVLAQEQEEFVRTVVYLLITAFGAALFSSLRAGILSVCIARLKVGVVTSATAFPPLTCLR